MCVQIILLRHTVFECYPICLNTPLFLGHPVDQNTKNLSVNIIKNTNTCVIWADFATINIYGWICSYLWTSQTFCAIVHVSWKEYQTPSLVHDVAVLFDRFSPKSCVQGLTLQNVTHGLRQPTFNRPLYAHLTQPDDNNDGIICQYIYL